MSLMRKILFISLVFSVSTLGGVFLSHRAHAATKVAPTAFRYAAWLPYWRKTAGTAEALAHLSQIQELSPFSYTLKVDGTIVDAMKLDREPWPSLLAAATSSKVTILPSIASGESSVIYALLANKTKRTAHVAQIRELVRANNFDGIDIDYEGKTAETKIYFSAFIKELATVLHKDKKQLSCTIEPRTPLNSLYYVPPTERIERSNEYTVLNKYCDQIRIMTYDQTTIDVKLNDLRGGKEYYAPIADVSWVHKVLFHALASFDRTKIMLGIPTYGYEYEIDPIAGNLRNYKIVRSWSYTDAYALAAKVGATPVRNKAGELSFTYATSTSVLAKNNPKPLTTTIGSTTPATTTQVSTNAAALPSAKSYTRLVWFTDAHSIGNIITLAKSYNLRGVAIFKLDGAADPAMWSKLTP